MPLTISSAAQSAEAHRDDAREQRRPVLLAGNPGKALDVDQQHDAQEQQQRAPDGVVDLHAGSVRRVRMTLARHDAAGTRAPAAVMSGYLARPAAFIVTPIAASALAMNAANSGPGAHAVP